MAMEPYLSSTYVTYYFFIDKDDWNHLHKEGSYLDRELTVTFTYLDERAKEINILYPVYEEINVELEEFMDNPDIILVNVVGRIPTPKESKADETRKKLLHCQLCLSEM